MKFVIEGKPTPWKRAGRQGKKYFDKQSEEKKRLRALLFEQLRNQEMILGPLKLTIEFHMVIPASWSKIKATKALKTPHSTTPDLDNLLKFLNDSLNQVLWKDDALIYEVHARKIYSHNPKTIFLIEQYMHKDLYPLTEE